jgi:hypothetical protein
MNTKNSQLSATNKIHECEKHGTGMLSGPPNGQSNFLDQIRCFQLAPTSQTGSHNCPKDKVKYCSQRMTFFQTDFGVTSRYKLLQETCKLQLLKNCKPKQTCRFWSSSSFGPMHLFEESFLLNFVFFVGRVHLFGQLSCPPLPESV